MAPSHDGIHDAGIYARSDCRVGLGADPAGRSEDARPEQSGLIESGGARILPFRHGTQRPVEIDAMKLGVILAVTLGVIAGEALGRMVGLDSIAAKFGA